MRKAAETTGDKWVLHQKKTCGFVLFEIKSNKVLISNVIKDHVLLAVEMKVRPLLGPVREPFRVGCISVKYPFLGGVSVT